MSVKSLVAQLVDAGLTAEQAGRLTLWQFNHLYCHPRDKEGRLLFAPPAGADEPYEVTFRAVWAARGLPPWRVEQKWREHLAREAEAHG